MPPLSVPPVFDEERTEVKSWRGGRVGPFWTIVVLAGVGALLLAASRTGWEILGPLLYLVGLATLAAPFVLVAAGVAYALFCASRWVARRVPAIPSFDSVAIGTMWLACGAVWLSTVEGLRSDDREQLVVGGIFVFGLMLVGFLLTHLLSPPSGPLGVGEAGLVIPGQAPRYVPFQGLSRLCIVHHGVVETDMIDTIQSFVPPPGVTCKDRVLAAVDTTGELVVELPLWGVRGRHLEAAVGQAYESWRKRPRRGASLATRWLARGEAPLSMWLNCLVAESERRSRESAYRVHGHGVEGLLDILWDESLPEDVRGGAAFVLLRRLPHEERVLVFDSVGAYSPPMVSAAAWCGARVAVRRRTRPYGEECLSDDDRETLQRLKRQAWLALVPFRRATAVDDPQEMGPGHHAARCPRRDMPANHNRDAAVVKRLGHRR